MTQHSARVVLVDDDQRHNLALSAILQGAGYRVLCCQGAESALQAVAFGCDCLITDYQMPGMNGAQLLRAVRSRVPVLIAVTGCDSSDVYIELLSAGATCIVLKPADPELLLAGVSLLCPPTEPMCLRA